MLGPQVDHALAHERGALAEPGHPVDDVHGEVEAVHVVHHDHVEGRGHGALLLVAAHVQVRVGPTPVAEPMDQPRIAVVGEDDRPVHGEKRVELGVRQPVRVLARRLQPHQVDDVDHTHPQLGEVLTQQVHRGEGLQRRYVAGAGQHDVGPAVVVAGPVPDADASRAVQHAVGHRQPVRLRVLAGDDHVDVVAAAQAVVHHGQQRVGVRRQVDPDHLGLLVHDVVDEAGVLVREPVVVLPPHVRGEQVVQRRDRPPPVQPPGHLQPLGVLVEHRVHDVHERLVAGEQPVPSGEQVALQPALAGVLAQDLHHPAMGVEVLVDREYVGVPGLAGRLVHRLQPVRLGLVGPDDPEVAVVGVGADDVAQPRAERSRRLRAGCAGRLDRNAVRPEVRQLQVARGAAAVGVRVGAEPPVVPRQPVHDLRTWPAVLIEELLRSIAAQP